MGVARSSIVAGPARIVRGTGTLFTKDTFTLNPAKQMLPITTAAHGLVDHRDREYAVSLNFTPEGRWDAATRAFLWPYSNPVIGQSVFGTSDTPCVIHSASAEQWTIIASAVTQMPGILFSAVETLVGPVTIEGVRGTGMDPDDADSLVTYTGSGGAFTDAGFSPALIKTQPYTLALTGAGAPAGFSAIDSETGWTVEFQTEMADIMADGVGLVDKRLASVGVLVRGVPINPTQAQMLNALVLQGTGAARGRSVFDTGYQIAITGADGSTGITVPKAAIVSAGFRFGGTVLRQGEIGFVAARNFSAGVAQALFNLA